MYYTNPDLLAEEFEDGELVVFDSEKDVSHIFNPSAALIYKIANNATKEEIIKHYLSYYLDPVQPDEDMRSQMVNDVNNILEILQEKGLIYQNGGD